MLRPITSAVRSVWSRTAVRALSSTPIPTEQPPLSVLNDDEVMLRDSVAQFAKSAIAPKVKAMDHDAKICPSLIKSCFEQGYMGIEIPEKYGGAGLNFTSAIIVIEELARVDPSVAVMVDVQNTLVSNAFLNFGSEEVKAKYLPILAKESVGSFCLSEACSGSDAFALRTKADKDGDHYVLNGSKCWITNAGDAGLYLVLANIDLSAGYKGITAFVVDRKNPGLRIGKKEDKLGIRASSTCEVILEDCRVHKSDILGEIGKGYKIAIETLNEGRIGIGAQMVGLARGAFDYALPYMNQRKQFGKPIADFQGMQFQYAQAYADITSARLMVYEAARRKESGLPFVLDAAMAKLKASQVASQVSTLAVQWMGGVGFTREFDAEKFYRDSMIGLIYEGTSNMQLQTIAKMVQKDYQ